MTAIGLFAFVAGTLLALAPLAQLIRTLELGSSRDVSTTWLVVLVIGASAWACYGIARHDPVIAVPNALSVLVAFATLLVVSHYRD